MIVDEDALIAVEDLLEFDGVWAPFGVGVEQRPFWKGDAVEPVIPAVEVDPALVGIEDA